MNKQSSQAQSQPTPRKKTGKKLEKKSLLESILGDSPLEITIKISDKDKEVITEKLDSIADRVDYRWKITQWLIVVGMVLNAASYLVSSVIGV